MTSFLGAWLGIHGGLLAVVVVRRVLAHFGLVG